jgi:hypothetical protein
MKVNAALTAWAAEQLGIPLMEAPVTALSFHQPWAEFILMGWKDVENRIWRSNLRGWYFMHASQCKSVEKYECALEFAAERLKDDRYKQTPPLKGILLGGIIGAMRIGPSILSNSPWSIKGQMQIPILEARRLPFLKCSGGQRWFVPKCSPP